MLNRICVADGIALVNIVRRPEQATLLRGQGPLHVCDAPQPTFLQNLAPALVDTGATVTFDATGGGALAGQILGRMESALNRTASEYSLQAPGAQPHFSAVVHNCLQPVGAAVGEDVGMVGLDAVAESTHHMRQQHVNAPAQVTYPERQPDRVDRDDRLNSRNQVARSRAWLSGQRRSTLAVPEPSATRMQVNVGAGWASAARTATNPWVRAGKASSTRSSRAPQRLKCAHQLCSSLNSIPLVPTHAVAFKPDAR